MAEQTKVSETITISKDEYERMIYAANMLGLLRNAFHTQKSYEFDSIAKVVFAQDDDEFDPTGEDHVE